MAVLESIRKLFVPVVPAVPEVCVPAPPTSYSVRPLAEGHLDDLLRLNLRCFRNGENYTRHTFNYLLTEPRSLGFQVVTAAGDMAGFVFVLVNRDGSAHLTTIGVAPEHRGRGLAKLMLAHLEDALRRRAATTVALEVRVSNVAAQKLYLGSGFVVVQRLARYYNNGEDCFLMMRSLA